jgi:hypothetical protein
MSYLFKKEELDVLKALHSDVESEEIRKVLRENLSIPSSREWKRDAKLVITVYKLVNLEVHYGEGAERDEIETFIQGKLRDFLSLQYRSIFLHYKNWIGLTPDGVKKLEAELRAKSVRAN